VDTRVAIIGLGYWGPNRLRALAELDGVEIGWVCDSDPARLARFAERYPTSGATTSYEEVLADESVTVIVLATPVHTHYTLAKQAIEAGRHVFVEKPLAASGELARDLVDRAAEAGTVLMCGHTFLYSPPVAAVKAVIDSGELGDLHFISSNRVNLGPYRSDVSVVFDLGPHDFSILRHWLDANPVSISAVGRDVIQPGIADVAFVDLTFASGLIAHVELSWLAPSKLRRTVIVGSEKMLVYEDGSPEPVRLYDSGIEISDPENYGEYQLSYRTGDIISLRVGSVEPIVAELEDFLAAISDGREPISNASTALDVIGMVEAAEASMERDGARVEIGARVGFP
jgi:predicted dehydrogenase